MLDECTNATSVDVEELLFETARDLGITILTVTQRPHLTQLYTQELRMLDGAGHWELCELKPCNPEEACITKDSGEPYTQLPDKSTNPKVSTSALLLYNSV